MSLVTKDVPSNVIAFGQPAKVIKRIDNVISKKV
jgi:acetyltransferase-like isoleucine patch superfamily enzyme